MSELKFLHGKNLDENHPISQGTFYLDLEKNELWYDDPSGANTTSHIRLFDGIFADIYEQLGDLNYKQITIDKFECTNVPSTLQVGSSVGGTLNFSWKTSKKPLMLKVNNEQIQEAITSTQGTINIVTSKNFNTKQTYKLSAEDERTYDEIKYPGLNAATKDWTFYFYHPVLYGSFDKSTTITSDVLNNTATISGTLKSAKSGTYNIDCGTAEDGRISVFAYPSDWGEAKMVVGGLEVEWSKMVVEYTPKNFVANNSLVTFTPTSIPYNVYYGSNVGLGKISVVVSNK